MLNQQRRHLLRPDVCNAAGAALATGPGTALGGGQQRVVQHVACDEAACTASDACACGVDRVRLASAAASPTAADLGSAPRMRGQCVQQDALQRHSAGCFVRRLVCCSCRQSVGAVVCVACACSANESPDLNCGSGAALHSQWTEFRS